MVNFPSCQELEMVLLYHLEALHDRFCYKDNTNFFCSDEFYDYSHSIDLPIELNKLRQRQFTYKSNTSLKQQLSKYVNISHSDINKHKY